MEPTSNGQRPPLQRPEPPQARKARNSIVPVLLVVVPLLFMTLGVVALTGRAGLLILAAIAAIPAFMLLHYLLWGYWLSKALRQNPPPDDSPER